MVSPYAPPDVDFHFSVAMYTHMNDTRARGAPRVLGRELTFAFNNFPKYSSLVLFTCGKAHT